MKSYMICDKRICVSSTVHREDVSGFLYALEKDLPRYKCFDASDCIFATCWGSVTRRVELTDDFGTIPREFWG